MKLSGAGALLLDYADRLLALADEAKSALHDTRPRGVLRLGAMESTAAVRLPAVFKRLQARHPELVVELHTGDPQQLAIRTLSGELDAALVAEPVDDHRLERLAVYEEELVVVAPLGQSAILSPRDIAQRTLLAFHPGCPHRNRLEAWFARGRVVPDRILELGSYHAILGCAAAGMGVALMPKSVLDNFAERANLSVHPMKGPYQKVKTLLIWRRDAQLAKIDALQEALGEKAKGRGRARGTSNTPGTRRGFA